MSQGQDPGSIPGASTKNTLAYVRIKAYKVQYDPNVFLMGAKWDRLTC